MRRSIKLLHEVGAIGLMGSLAVSVVLASIAPTGSLVAYAAHRQDMAAISKWLVLPSLVLVTISGLLAILANRAYLDAGWAWFKALLGISMFEGTLLTVAASARRAAELSTMAAAGNGDLAALAPVLRSEWHGLWFLIALSLANVVLAIWRPRQLWPLRQAVDADDGREGPGGDGTQRRADRN
jgi:hypothetical protein